MLKGTVFKWIVAIGSVSVLSLAAGSMGYSFILLPRAPVINSFALSNLCSPILTFTDKSSNESGFLVSFRPQGAQNFNLIMVLPAQPGHGVTVTTPPSTLQFPDGTYEIKVAAYNSYGQADDLQTVMINTCPNSPPLPSGFLVAPLLVHAEVVNGCDIRIDFVDFNEPPSITEDGLHVWRQINGTNGAVIADISPTGKGSFIDTTVGPNNYQYKIGAYQGTTELYSNLSDSINISAGCLVKFLQTFTFTPTVSPTPTLDMIIITPKKLSCEWEAAENVFLRKGPDVGQFERLTDVQKGQRYPIVGQSEDGQFWAVEVSPGVIGYITKSEKYSRVSGDCADVPKLTDPEPPEVAPVATKKPGDPAGPAACGDGVDNDGDGLVDYNADPAIGDPGCSSSGDTSE